MGGQTFSSPQHWLIQFPPAHFRGPGWIIGIFVKEFVKNWEQQQRNEQVSHKLQSSDFHGSANIHSFWSRRKEKMKCHKHQGIGGGGCQQNKNSEQRPIQPKAISKKPEAVANRGF